MDSDALPGDFQQPSRFSLPDAVTTVMPASTMLSKALLRAWERSPPNDMEAMAGRMALFPTQSMELVMPVVLPEPLSPRTFTACR